MNREQYHQTRRTIWKLNRSGSTNDIGYCQYEADNNRKIAYSLWSGIQPRVDYQESERNRRWENLNNWINEHIKRKSQPKKTIARPWSIWP